MEWAEGFQAGRKGWERMAFTKVYGVKVSTVFLGLDHNYEQIGPPIVFETMVFGGPLDREQIRYATADEALVGHEAMVERVALLELDRAAGATKQ